MSNRAYSDDFKATALAALVANGGNVQRTADDLDVPESTLRSWREGVGTRAVSANLRDQKREELSARVTQVAWSIVDSIDETDIENASLVQKTTAFGILFDKMRLLSDEATEISENRNGRGLRESILTKFVAVHNSE